MELTEVDVSELRTMDAPSLLRFAFERFGERAAIGTSLQKTGVVAIDLASRLGIPFRVFFVDTRLNYPETYELLGRVEQRYGITIERFAPSEQDLESLYEMFGQHAHYFGRDTCCRVRKQLPLQRALGTLDAWIAGLRVDQSAHRGGNAEKARFVETEDGRRILKLNPLLDWTERDVDEYTERNDLPYNDLYDYVSPYDERFKVIGCRPCHVPVKEGFDKRMGKFPWEQGHKECGMHNHGGGI